MIFTPFLFETRHYVVILSYYKYFHIYIIMNKCGNVCDNEYLKEHIRVVKEQGSKTPDKKTLKLIKGDCMRKICNPGCKNTNTVGVKDSFHSDYTIKEKKFLKDLGVLSWCHPKPMQWGNVKPFNVMNLSKTKQNKRGGYKKNKTKKSKMFQRIKHKNTKNKKTKKNYK